MCPGVWEDNGRCLCGNKNSDLQQQCAADQWQAGDLPPSCFSCVVFMFPIIDGLVMCWDSQGTLLYIDTYSRALVWCITEKKKRASVRGEMLPAAANTIPQMGTNCVGRVFLIVFCVFTSIIESRNHQHYKRLLANITKAVYQQNRETGACYHT